MSDATPGTSPVPVEAHAAPTAQKRQRASVSRSHIILTAALVATTVWGTWVSKSLYDLRHQGPNIVKIQLQDLVGGYIRAQARSASPPERTAIETKAFLGEVDTAVKALSASGKVVLVSEAVAAGDVPDVTDQVRKAVFAKIPTPRVAAAESGVDAQMLAYLQQGGAANGSGN